MPQCRRPLAQDLRPKEEATNPTNSGFGIAGFRTPDSRLLRTLDSRLLQIPDHALRRTPDSKLLRSVALELDYRSYCTAGGSGVGEGGAVIAPGLAVSCRTPSL